MTPEQAAARLKAMTAASKVPTLTDEQIADLVTRFRLADSAGLAPDDAGWVPTYDLNGAAAEGWRLKASDAASMYQITVDGQQMNRQQVYEHCVAQEKRYRRKRMYALSLEATPHAWARRQSELPNP